MQLETGAKKDFHEELPHSRWRELSRPGLHSDCSLSQKCKRLSRLQMRPVQATEWGSFPDFPRALNPSEIIRALRGIFQTRVEISFFIFCGHWPWHYCSDSYQPRTPLRSPALAGWLVLPAGNYPVGSANAVFPYWITVTAVPSDMLLTKNVVAPVDCAGRCIVS